MQRIKVLMGGVSREREISLKSGRAVLDALRSRGFRAEEYVVDDELMDGVDSDNTDVAFIALHGRFGEDGGAQAVLEERGVRYTGSGPEASRLAMDKAATKSIFTMHGVPTPSYLVFKGAATGSSSLVRDSFGFPCVVKPAREGSSIGVVVVRDADAFEPAVSAAFNLDDTVIVEEYVAGREMTCGILGDEALPLVELLPAREFYDYTAKYAPDGGTEYTLDVGLDDALYKRIQDYALAAHRALGCRGMSRVDLILSGSGEPYFLEVNTIPGMTLRSLLPKAAAAAGYDFPILCARIIELAMDVG
jgi:D-alanine-D-alanine ligase